MSFTLPRIDVPAEFYLSELVKNNKKYEIWKNILARFQKDNNDIISFVDFIGMTTYELSKYLKVPINDSKSNYTIISGDINYDLPRLNKPLRHVVGLFIPLKKAYCRTKFYACEVPKDFTSIIDIIEDKEEIQLCEKCIKATTILYDFLLNNLSYTNYRFLLTYSLPLSTLVCLRPILLTFEMARCHNYSKYGTTRGIIKLKLEKVLIKKTNKIHLFIPYWFRQLYGSFEFVLGINLLNNTSNILTLFQNFGAKYNPYIRIYKSNFVEYEPFETSINIIDLLSGVDHGGFRVIDPNKQLVGLTYNLKHRFAQCKNSILDFQKSSFIPHLYHHFSIPINSFLKIKYAEQACYLTTTNVLFLINPILQRILNKSVIDVPLYKLLQPEDISEIIDLNLDRFVINLLLCEHNMKRELAKGFNYKMHHAEGKELSVYVSSVMENIYSQTTASTLLEIGGNLGVW